MQKWLVIAVVIVLLVISAGWLYSARSAAAAAAAANTATEVRAEKATRGQLAEIVSAPGEIVPLTKVNISSKVQAKIRDLPFKEGALVRAGDILITLDDKELKAALRSVEAHYAAQKATLDVTRIRLSISESQVRTAEVLVEDARRDLRRQLALLESKDVAQNVVDAAQTKVDQLDQSFISARQSLLADRGNISVLENELVAQEAQIARAREALSDTVITSPIDGRIIKISGKVGEVVVTGTMNNAGTVILVVADLSRMLATVRLDEAEVTQVVVGQPASVRSLAYPDKIFKGKVRQVSLSKDDTAGQSNSRNATGSYFRGEILLDEGIVLLAGVNADIEIETHRYDGVLRVPSQSVLGRSPDSLKPENQSKPEVDSTRSQTTVVYRIVNGKTIETPVKVGASDLTHTMIISGLAEGDQVVTGPAKVLGTLSDGMNVRIKAAATQPSTQATTQSATTVPTTTPTTAPTTAPAP